jgi:hypothetical protein
VSNNRKAEEELAMALNDLIYMGICDALIVGGVWMMSDPLLRILGVVMIGMGLLGQYLFASI